MICKTTAIALRFTPVSETSRAVMWLTEDAGRMVTLIKGSQRPKGLFLGQYDLFYTCELLYYHRERDGLFITRECSPLIPRDHLREQWRAAMAASYFADLVRQSTDLKAPHPALFPLLEKGLDAVNQPIFHPALVFWFELKLLDHLGLSPRLDRCLRCRGKLPAIKSMPWSTSEGGAICPSCAATNPTGQTITSDILAFLAYWQKSRNLQAVQNSRCRPDQLQHAARKLGDFLRYHLDRALPSRNVAMSLLLPPRLKT